MGVVSLGIVFVAAPERRFCRVEIARFGALDRV
jgi:hypothetical protein